MSRLFGQIALLGLTLLTRGLWGAEGDTLWTFDTQGEVFGAPARDASGNLYFGNREGKVFAVDSNGAELWVFQTQDWVDSSPTLSPDESVVYFGSWDNRLYAVSTETGAELWSYETGNLIVASPAVDRTGNVYFGSSDGFVYSLDSEGNLRWLYLVGDELDSSPAVAEDGTVYVGSYDGSLYAFSGDGGLKWSYATPETEDPSDQRIKSPPTIDFEGNVYFGGGDGRVHALDAAGNLLWVFETSGKVDTGVAIREDGALVFGSRDGFVYCVDENGVQQWRSFVGDIFYSTPAVDSAGRVYVGAYVGNGVSGLTALSAVGEIVWESLVLDYVDSSPLLDGEGRLYFGCYDGSLYAVECLGATAQSDWPRFGGDSGNRSQQALEDGEFYLSEQFEQWVESHGLFGEAAEAVSDQDRDGFALLTEYWLGMDPKASDAPEFSLRFSDGVGLEVRHYRVKGEVGYTMRWQYSLDGIQWQDFPEAGEGAASIEILSDDAFGDGEYEYLRTWLPVEGGSVFFRLRMSGL